MSDLPQTLAPNTAPGNPPAAAYLIGIGGAGLSAIARLLLESGWQVSGSDRSAGFEDSPLGRSLHAAGAQLFSDHKAAHLRAAHKRSPLSVVVRSSAIPDTNVEVRAAKAAGIPVLKRADFLGQFMAGHTGIAVAGTHGKTTTSAMFAWVLHQLGLDPSFIVGGIVTGLGVNAHAGSGPHFVIEADEYDRMFLGLRPTIAVVTNVEHDHPDCYPTPDDFYQSFVEFTRLLGSGGALLACVDDPGAAQLAAQARTEGRVVFTYAVEPPTAPGKGAAWVQAPPNATPDHAPDSARLLDTPGWGDPNYLATGLHPNSLGGLSFTIAQLPTLGTIQLHAPGVHNVSNALAVLAAAHRLGLDMPKVALALSEFRTPGRRFELLGEPNGVAILDDYAHHPTEIRATLAAARLRYPGRRIWAVWQPHTFSRLAALGAEFATAFTDADQVVVSAVYASRETPPPGEQGPHSTAAQMAAAIQGHTAAHVQHIPALADITAHLQAHVQPGDVVLVLSAGDATQVSAGLLASLNPIQPDEL